MIVDKIVEKTKEELELKKAKIPFDLLGRSLSSISTVKKDVITSLKKTNSDPYKIIAEIKKASPSKGVIREEFYPEMIASSYDEGGANAISVLTEPNFFLGDINYLSLIKRYTTLPLLRKDFIIDRYQVLESAVFGADFILLIAGILSQKELKELVDFARELNLEVLVEVHNRSEIRKTIFAGASIIGINHRDLRDFTMNMELCFELLPSIPTGKVVVAESGLSDKEFIKELSRAGIDAFLMGEYFMRKDDIKSALEEIKER